MGGTAALGDGSLMSVDTDSPLSGAKSGDVNERRNLWIVAGFP